MSGMWVNPTNGRNKNIFAKSIQLANKKSKMDSFVVRIIHERN